MFSLEETNLQTRRKMGASFIQDSKIVRFEEMYPKVRQQREKPKMHRWLSNPAPGWSPNLSKTTQTEETDFSLEKGQLKANFNDGADVCACSYTNMCSDKEIKTKLTNMMKTIDMVGKPSLNMVNVQQKVNLRNLKQSPDSKDTTRQLSLLDDTISMKDLYKLGEDKDAIYNKTAIHMDNRKMVADKYDKHFENESFKILTDLLKFRTFPQAQNGMQHFMLDHYFQNVSNGACSIPEENMSNELLRLSSLSTFPRDIDISLTRLAKTGFYQNGQPGETKCYSCGVTYRNWKSGDNPLEIHKGLSPGCTLVCNNNTTQTSSMQNSVSVEKNSSEASNNPGGQNADEMNSTSLLSANNVAITSKSIGSAALNTSQSRNSNVSSESVTSQSRNSNVSSESVTSQSRNSNMSSESSTSQSQNSNRTSERSSTEQNPLSLQTNQNNARSTSEINESVSSNQQLSNNGGIETLGINIDKPKYPNYATLQTRMSSYQGWPAYLDQTPRDMAMAGFLFAGYNDYTRCFFCGGGLRNWEAGDDPWVEHARWFPQCAFLKQNKGERFIQAVLKKQQEVEQESMRTSGQSGRPTSPPRLPAATNHTLEPSHVSENDPLGSIAARSVLEMGYSKDKVLGALKKISLRPGLKEISATDIMRIIQKEEDDKELSCQGAAGNAMKQNSSENVAVSEVIPELFNDEETQALMEENRQLRDQRVCKVCMDLEATIAFLPCGHIVCCSDCAPAMRKCPLCRTFIKGTVKTFLA